MSYLMSFKQIRPHAFRVQWRSVSGTIYTSGPEVNPHLQISYRKYSRLGQLLRNNSECERKFIADAVEKATRYRPSEWAGN